MIKVHVGCGWRDFGEDWWHVDGGDYPHLDGKKIDDLPWGNNSVDLIYASHVIAYFDRSEIIPILKHWHAKLKPGGTLRVGTPDFTVLSCMYCDGQINIYELLGPLYGKMPMGVQKEHSSKLNMIYHKTTYDRNSLTKLLESCGFTGVRPWDWRATEHAEFDDHSQAYIPHMNKNSGTLISLNLEATK